MQINKAIGRLGKVEIGSVLSQPENVKAYVFALRKRDFQKCYLRQPVF